MPKKQTDGDLIRSARLAAGLTQDELAKLIGVTRYFVSNLETGKRRANLTHLKAIARACRGEFRIRPPGRLFYVPEINL